ncbi:hypothetical protein MSAS_34010 [Mycobacterium saskatchewanense]|nr:hypothetical protein MSAS_34010 [Mycobacterium saskatchewanense]
MTGGLWPAGLSTVDPETASIAAYLKDDLERIARSANDELKVIKRSGLADPARKAEEARVIEEGRARAVRRVESTIRQLEAIRAQPGPVEPEHAERDPEATQVIPATSAAESAATAPAEAAPERRWRAAEPGRRRTEPAPVTDDHVAAMTDAPIDDTQGIPAVTDLPPAAAAAEPRRDVTDSGRHRAVEPAAAEEERADTGERATAIPPMPEPGRGREFDIDRLNLLLEFVVRQEPRLNWAAGERADGTTVVVTDLAHGWVPPGISLPAGVGLLEPGRRSGKATEMIGDTTRVVRYAPGDSLRRSAGLAALKASLEPRELPEIDDLGGALNTATRRREGLPRIVHAMASTAAAGTRIADQEVDVLRVHLDTARYQLLVQFPDVDPALLLDCLLLAATEAFVVGDITSANYHLRWFQTLEASPSP